MSDEARLVVLESRVGPQRVINGLALLGLLVALTALALAIYAVVKLPKAQTAPHGVGVAFVPGTASYGITPAVV